MNIGLGANDAARVARLHMFARRLESGALAPLEADLHDAVGLLDRIDHGPAFAYIVSERFLAINIQTMIEGGDKLKGVPMRRCGDDDGLEAGALSKSSYRLKVDGPVPCRWASSSALCFK